MDGRSRIALWLILMACLLGLGACTQEMPYVYGSAYDEDLPDDPVERAAILGVHESFRNSAMYELRNLYILSVQPMIPTEAFVQEHDPRELYCVCLEFEGRYKVPWATEDSSPWLWEVRNILVIQTKGGHYIALMPSGICPQHCR